MASKAEHPGRFKTEVIAIGIDVAKRRHVGVIRLPDGFKTKPFAFSNNRPGFEKLLTRTSAAQTGWPGTSVLFALESTGHYGHALRYFLVGRDHSVVAINPFHTKQVKELEDNSPEKSDPKDAGLIADLAAQGRGFPVRLLQGPYADLRRLGKLRERLSNERTRWLNRYKGLVDLGFPEVASFVANVACPSIRELMGEFPSAGDVARLEFPELHSRLRRWSIGHLSADRCQCIHKAAHDSVGIREGLTALRLEMRQTLSALKTAEQRIGEVEQDQAETLRQVPYAEHLLSIPQLGSMTVATILGETGDLRQYRHADAVIKMAGLNLYTRSSGTFRGKTRITKRGRPLLRRVLYLAALRLSRRGLPLAEFHDRLSPRIEKPQVFVAACRKLVRVMMALVRESTCYQEGRLAVPIRMKPAA